VFLILGIGAGLQMAISGDHGAFPAHAHINLLGWVTSAIFGGYYALNPAKAERRIAMVHYGVYTLGLAIMMPALYLMLQGNPAIEPIVGVGSLIVAAAVLIFAFVVFSAETVRSVSGLPSATR
jgi:peptidoglycan/LPS O-acetylase OafA/YrhL